MCNQPSYWFLSTQCTCGWICPVHPKFSKTTTLTTGTTYTPKHRKPGPAR